MRYTKVYLVYFITHLLCSFSLMGKDYPLIHYTNSNGLPSNNVYSIYRDKKGFLWIATDKGIARYNGLEFEKFTTDDGLPCNDIFFFEEDKYGRLWMSTYNGELCYYKDGEFHTAKNTAFLNLKFSHLWPEVMTSEPDSSFTIWFRDHKHFAVIKNEKLSFYDLDFKSIDVQNALFLYRKQSDRFVLVMPYVSFMIDTAKKIIEKIEHKNRDQYSFHATHLQNYLLSNSGIYSVNEEPELKFTNGEIVSTNIYRVLKFDNIWYTCTTDGLFINNNIHILAGRKASGIERDMEGNYWISTLNDGIYCMGKQYKATEQFNINYPGQVKYASIVSGNLFYLDEFLNFYRFDTGNPKLLSPHRLFNSNGSQGTHPNSGDYIDANFQYYHIQADTSYDIEGLNTTSPKTHGISYQYEDPDYRSFMPFFKEMIGVGDKLYIRNTYYISYVDTKKDANSPCRTLVIPHKPSFEKRIFCMAVSNDSSVWYSSLDSVYKIENGISKVQKQFGNLSFRNFLFANSELIGVTGSNKIVVCECYNSEHPRIKVFDDPNVVWDKIYQLNDSTLLVSTSNLYRIISIHHTLDGKKTYDLMTVENDFLPIQCEFICCNDSFCYFFKNGTITKVVNSNIVLDHKAPEVFFKYLKTRTSNYPAIDGTILSFSDARNISITFNLLSFGTKHPICEYSVSKNGGDYWRPLQNNEINLYDASYGDYIVKVKVRNVSGSFEQPNVFHFSIAKPYWATWWFFWLCGIVAFYLLYIIVKYNQRRLKKDKVYLEKELSTLRLQMNPHFLFNTLNSIYSLAKISSVKTADMVLKLSEMLRYVAYKSDQPLATISEEIEIIENYISLQMVRFDDRVRIEKEITLDDPKVLVVPLLILPLIENAFKHGIGLDSDNSTIQIIIRLKQNALYVKIQNSVASESVKQNGYGGLGLANTKRQLALLYRDHNLSIVNTGSEFVVNLSININSYAKNKMSGSRG